MKKTVIIGALLFVVATTVYWKSIPHSFNTIYENKRFFDSDGEFIVRQYRQGKTFTHNDHLLYHIAAKAVQQHSASFPSLKGDVVRSHKLLSVVAGALGLVLLYLMGLHMTSRHLPAALGALFVGGTSGWWFFSATIDTYLPCLCISTATLWAAMALLRKPSLRGSAALGALAGLAFLLRTDSVLLGILGLALPGRDRGVGARIGVAAAAALLVGIGGYFILAHGCYGIAWRDVLAWAQGGIHRPEAAVERAWGVAANLSGRNILKVLTNHACYAALIPIVAKTQDPNLLQTYSVSGMIALALYVTIMLSAVAYIVVSIRGAISTRSPLTLILPAIAVLWLTTRVLFYAWWDPRDPFLFAVMSLPALWLLLMLGAQQAYHVHEASRAMVWAIPATLLILTSLVWVHNLRLLIIPLRSFA